MLVNDYVMHRENVPLQTVASRLLYDLLPGLDTSVIFNETEGLVEWMLTKAEHANEPLRSYSTGLLGAAMEIQSLAEKYKDQSMRLNAILLKRLKELAIGLDAPDHQDEEQQHSSIRHKSSDSPPHHQRQHNNSSHQQQRTHVKKSKGCGDDAQVLERTFAASDPIVGSFSLYPLTTEMQLRLILQCLTPISNYLELLLHVFVDTVRLILQQIDLNRNRDILLSFGAMKYLFNLFGHKTFALDLLERGALQR